MDMPSDFFNSGPFMPHGGCYLWTQSLIALHAISDALIVLAYYSIPIMLVYFVRKRKDLKFHWMFVCFAVFILACGTTHLMEIWNIWHANYWLSGSIKAITAMASVPTAILLVKLIPRALALPSPDALQKAYGELEERVTERTLQLKSINETLVQEVHGRQKAQRESHESEARLRAVLDSSLNAVVVISTGGEISDWNARAEIIFGWKRKEVIGRDLAEIIIPSQHREAHQRGMKHFLATGEGPVLNRLIQMSAIRRNGDEFPVELFIRALTTGDTVTFCGFITDITERKRIEEKLKSSLKEVGDLKSALDEHAIVAITDSHGKISSVNDKFCTISKYSREELIGQDHRIINSGHHSKEFIRNLWTMITSGKVWHGEIKNRAKDGSFYWVDTTIVPFLNEQGKVYQYVAIRADITVRRQAEETLARLTASSLARLAAIVEFSDDAIIGKDLQGIVTSWNTGAETLFGFLASEIIGQSILRIFPSGRAQEETEIMDRIARSESVKHFETERIRKDGSRISISVTISPIKNLAGKIVGASTVARDNTEHKQAEAQLLADITERKHQAEALGQSNEALERSNVELAQFAYIASHDLQTPLRNITGFVQLLKANYAGKLDEKANGWISRIVESSGQMHALIEDVLTYSHVDSRAVPFELVSLTDVFNDSVVLLEASIHEVDGEVTRGELPSVMGDRSQLVQLTQNLIGNGLKYHGEKKPHVHVSAKRDGNDWLVTIRDNGIGIAQKHHERIFEIFKRLHNQQEYPGTGIGLAVCRRVVHRHGGRIWVESEDGCGCTFNFTIRENAVGKL